MHPDFMSHVPDVSARSKPTETGVQAVSKEQLGSRVYTTWADNSTSIERRHLHRVERVSRAKFMVNRCYGQHRAVETGRLDSLSRKPQWSGRKWSEVPTKSTFRKTRLWKFGD